MIAYVFPGQGAQFVGMGSDLYQSDSHSKAIFDQADDILGYSLSKVMFEGTADELKETKVTQPALFVHAIATYHKGGMTHTPDAVAGHSLGEFSALVACGALSFSDGLQLVYKRAMAMQQACESVPGTMAAILGLENDVVEEICNNTDGTVVAANYNCPGQLVISGSIAGVEAAAAACTEAGARRAVMLPVGGAFHSPLMQPAKDELEQAIMATEFDTAQCPVYQNVDGQPHTDPATIQQNLVAQLTGPVKWTQIMEAMVTDGITSMIEVGGNGKVLAGLFRKMDRKFPSSAL